jgi:aspartyl-tRNA(Asn)/glutamyl-tRNA(Gln) amidotransferase subunit B
MSTETSALTQNAYETVIGLEVHVELSTATKIFCGCRTDFGGAPNSHTCPVCTGMPGALPVLNKKVLEAAIAVGLATGCEITRVGRFDRKNYFYPDNPQNYQISQLYFPICRKGSVEIETRSGKKSIGITEIHMEEDAGKLYHAEDGTSLVDYNRSGVPLLEIVTEPDLSSGEEAVAFLEKLRTMISYLGVSDCKMQEGSMRADVNLSVRKPGEDLGTRTEMKNLGSFRSVIRAAEAETKRQIDLLEAGEQVLQETRRFDEASGTSFSMRSKEEARDYRYFPDPDLPPIVVSDELIEKIRAEAPEHREARILRFETEYGLPEYDCKILTGTKVLGDFFEETTLLAGAGKTAIAEEQTSTYKKVSNFIMGELLHLQKERGMDEDEIPMSPEHLAELIRMTEEGLITGTVAKQIFEVMFDKDCDPRVYANEQDLCILKNEGVIESAVDQILATETGPVAEYLSGKEKVLGYLVGQTMKALQGKADAGEIRELLLKRLKDRSEVNPEKPVKCVNINDQQRGCNP